MRKYIYSSLLFILLCSCADYLEKTPDEDMTLQEVFESRNYAEKFLTSAYTHMSRECYQADNAGFAGGASDELEITRTYPYCNKLNEGSWNPSTTTFENWKIYWEGIRITNIFLENIDKTPMDQEAKDTWIGEAYFLRALYHFYLFRMYGPIPLADQSFDVNNASAIERKPVGDCVRFITEDCDRALNTPIPMQATSNQYGRATKAAALALKARTLLYAASPLFNGNTDYANFKNTDGTQLIPTSTDKELWKQAADAALACINQCEGAGYALYRENDPMKSYQNLFLKRWNSEVLFAQNMEDNWLHESYMNPNGMGGWSGYCLTQEMVDSYHMANGERPILGYNGDGTPIINPASGYMEKGFSTKADPNGYYPDNIYNMYVDREPRFYASVNYNGAMWKGRRIEFWPGGKDGKTTGPDYTKTGYLVRKASDENYDLPTGNGKSLYTWIIFRLGEQYLNYAEAINEYEGPSKAYPYLNTIRNRAGLPDLPKGLSQDEMREKIRHEKRIEMAFESQRYYDCRRWKISPQTDGSWIHGMNINAGTSIRDEAFYERITVEKRIFENKHYLWPIPQNEIDKCRPSLIQSPGWELDETRN